jgi:hypothetical protein
MFPKEHGAYGQLLFPLITALAIGRPGAGALALAGAAIAAFFAHEPLLVLLGHRGARAAREERARAVRWFALFATPAAALALVAYARFPDAARNAMLLLALLGAVLGATIVLGGEHTLAGETLTAVALSALCVPLAIGSGAPPYDAHTIAFVYGASFVSATACVHGVIARTRKPPAIGARATGVAVALLSIGVLAQLGRLGRISDIAPWAALPLCVGGTALALFPPSARRLRIVGWTLVAGTTLTAGVLIAALR